MCWGKGGVSLYLLVFSVNSLLSYDAFHLFLVRQLETVSLLYQYMPHLHSLLGGRLNQTLGK